MLAYRVTLGLRTKPKSKNPSIPDKHHSIAWHRRALVALGCCERSLFNKEQSNVYMINTDYSSLTLSHFPHPNRTPSLSNTTSLPVYFSQILNFLGTFCDQFSLSRASCVTTEWQHRGVTRGCTSVGNGFPCYASASSK